jgi:DNA-binding MarR family transcriptional regulator
MTTSATVADVEAAARTRATDAVQDELVLLLRRIRARFAHLARDIHPEVDAGAYAILHLVHSGQATTLTGLADQLGVGKPTLSRQISALEDLGFLERVTTPQDRRVAALALTAEGTRRMGDIRDARDERFRALLHEWPVEDLATFARLLGRFNALEI